MNGRKCHLLVYGLERGGGIQQQATRQAVVASAREAAGGGGLSSAGRKLQQSSHSSRGRTQNHKMVTRRRCVGKYSVFHSKCGKDCFSRLPKTLLLPRVRALLRALN